MIDREITLVSRTKGTVVPLRGEEHTLVACTPSSPNSRPRAKRPFLKTSTPKLRNLIRSQYSRDIFETIRTILEHLSELLGPLKVDLLEKLLQHGRWPGQARRRAASQSGHAQPSSCFHAAIPAGVLSPRSLGERDNSERGEARRGEARRAFPSNHGQPRDVVT